MNLFDDNDSGFDDFDDFGFDDSDSSSVNTDNSESLDDFSNSDDVLSGDDTVSGGAMASPDSGGLKKTAVIMIIIGVIVVIGVFCLARVILNKDKESKPQETPSTITSVATQEPVPQTTVNAQELMGGNKPQSNTGTNNNVGSNNIENYNDNYWISIDGKDQIVFSEPQEVKFHITDIKHYIAKAEGSDNYIVKSTLQGSISGYSGTFHLDVPYEKGVQLLVGQEFTAYITIGTWNGKTVIGEISY